MSVMKPAHFRWEEFRSRLEGPEGCNFRDDPEYPDDITKVKWNCFHNFRFATKILESIEGVDVAKSLAALEKEGGRCDCTILFNVLTPAQRKAERKKVEQLRKDRKPCPTKVTLSMPPEAAKRLLALWEAGELDLGPEFPVKSLSLAARCESPDCPDSATCVPCEDERHDGACCLTHCKACSNECLPEVV